MREVVSKNKITSSGDLQTTYDITITETPKWEITLASDNCVIEKSHEDWQIRSKSGPKDELQLILKISSSRTSCACAQDLQTSSVNTQINCNRDDLGELLQEEENEDQEKSGSIILKDYLRLLTTGEAKINFILKIFTQAVHESKTFVISGIFPVLRKPLAKRGWLEKRAIRRMLEIPTDSNDHVVDQIEKLLRHPADFVWYTNKKAAALRSDDKTIINKFAGSYFTSKVDMCNNLENVYWFYEAGVSSIQFPRCYNICQSAKVEEFIQDYYITACSGILKWLLFWSSVSGPGAICSPQGSVPISAILFALERCVEFISIHAHEDIDREDYKAVAPAAWCQFLDWYEMIVKKKALLKDEHDDKEKLKVILVFAENVLREMSKYRPQSRVDGMRNIWILKPGDKSLGRGIVLKSSLGDILNKVNQAARESMQYVVQKYIERPLLVHKTKIDVRQWFLITCTQPLIVWMYKDILIRFASRNFTLDDFHESIHLCNTTVQMKYRKLPRTNLQLPGELHWNLQNFKDYLRSKDQEGAWERMIRPGIKQNLIGALLASQDYMMNRKHTFQLYGADFVIMDDFSVWLIEINTNPRLHPPSSEVTTELYPKVIEDTMKEFNEQPRYDSNRTHESLIHRHSIIKPNLLELSEPAHFGKTRIVEKLSRLVESLVNLRMDNTPSCGNIDLDGQHVFKEGESRRWSKLKVTRGTQNSPTGWRERVVMSKAHSPSRPTSTHLRASQKLTHLWQNMDKTPKLTLAKILSNNPQVTEKRPRESRIGSGRSKPSSTSSPVQKVSSKLHESNDPEKLSRFTERRKVASREISLPEENGVSDGPTEKLEGGCSDNHGTEPETLQLDDQKAIDLVGLHIKNENDFYVTIQKRVEDAIKNKKIFLIRADIPYLEDVLKKRGWLQKYECTKTRHLPYGSVASLDAPSLGNIQQQDGGLNERCVIFNILRQVPPDFIWDARNNFVDWHGPIKHDTLLNRFEKSFVYTSKVINAVRRRRPIDFFHKREYVRQLGMATILENAHWYHEKNVADVRYPRSYNVARDKDAFVEDYRRTAAVSLLKWFVRQMDEGVDLQMKGDRPISARRISFAVQRCEEMAAAMHDEFLDLPDVSISAYEWGQFMEDYIRAVHEGNGVMAPLEIDPVELDKLSFPTLYELSVQVLRRIRQADPQYELNGTRNIWILKPNGLCCGTGIVMSHRLNNIVKRVYDCPRDYFVVQKYIEKPLLVKNTKFDVRQWYLVTKSYPLTIWIYKESLLRFSSRPFTFDNYHEIVHICNTAVQNKYVESRSSMRAQNWTCDKLNDYLKATGYKGEPWYDEIYPKICQAIIGTMLAAQEHMDTRRCSFELYGADFIIMEDLSVWLIEINTNPRMHPPSTRITQRLYPDVLESLLKVVMDYPTNPNVDTGRFVLAYQQAVSDFQPYIGTSMYALGKSVC